MDALSTTTAEDVSIQRRSVALYHQNLDANNRQTDRMFAWLMVLQWLGGMVAAIWISPLTWEGEVSHIHVHVYAAVFLGGLISGLPVAFALLQPGKQLTRHIIAVGQMFSCGLLIHLSGGRIESHFQYFVTLAFLAFYLDWRVLLTATVAATADHFIRGIWWPQSIFGADYVSLSRPWEHVGWVLFEDVILVLSIRQNLNGMFSLAHRQAQMELVNEMIESKVEERTRELRNQIAEREAAESARKMMEERLYQSQKMETVGKLAGGVAHEFNSILTAIIGHSEVLLRDLMPQDPSSKAVHAISVAAQRAATLTRQLLAYGRKQIMQPEVIDLNAVLTEMQGTLQHLVGREVELRLLPSTDLRKIKIDPGQVEQVIVNITMNAADAMPNGGQFTLETRNVVLDEEYVRPFPGLKAADYVMLAMTDTGVGMNDDVKSRVFEPFFSTKGVGLGSGLGLATCYGILKQSGGHINVYSELSRGTTFKIYLPQVNQPAKATTQRLKSGELPHGSETILLVEDDPSLREMSEMLLSRLGYNVLTAADGIEALSLKNRRDIGHIDLLFTDVVMPHMSGKELSERMKAIYPLTKILFTSAYTENAIVHQGMLLPGVILLQKPFTPSMLARKVREVLDQA